MFKLKNVTYKNIINIDEMFIPNHQITCIIGESGAGKSTLLKLLNKMISYDSGDILFHEQSIKEIEAIELRRQVALLPQSPVIYPGTVKDNLLIGLQFQNKPIVSDVHLNQILAFVQLKKQLGDEAQPLSGGEKQRLALGRLLILDPEVILLDEPSSALDEVTAHQIIMKLAEYTLNHHKTLVMVTHSKAIAQEFADQIIEIKKIYH
jgi:putative ABC transport system ATP-binding protein